MSRKSKLTALFLASLLAAQTLTACGGSETVGEGGDTTPAETTPAETTWEFHDELGDLRFDGEEFNMYIACPQGELIQEEETGDVLDDSVYARNRAVEERLGIKLNYIESGFGSSGGEQSQATAAIRSAVMSGDDAYDCFLHVQHTGMPACITEGMFINWNDLPNVDLTKPYWYSTCIRDINYGERIYAMTGAYVMGVMSSANVMFFNKTLFDEASIEYPYQDVLDGTWTFDTFKKSVETLTQDLNGDTQITTADDQLGYWGWGYEQLPAMFLGLGGDLITRGEDGEPVDNLNTEKNLDVTTTMQNFFKDLTGAKCEWSTYGIFNTAFTSGRLGYLHASISLAVGDTLREMEDDFGFIPYPKADEKQEDYFVRIQNTAALTYIPVTNQDLEFTGAVLEVMSSITYNTVIPTYFDIALTVKSTRDTESEQMVPIIQSNTAFIDSYVSFDIKGIVLDGKALPTWYASNIGTITKQMEDLTATFIGDGPGTNNAA